TFGPAPDTTTALSVTSISASTIPPISTDDYEISHTKGGEGAGADVEAVVDEGSDPFPNGPSYLGTSFPVSSARLASLLRYTKSPGLKLVFRTFELEYFSIFALLLASRIVASSLLSSKRFKLIFIASLFPTRSTSAVLSVDMPISARMTASVPYVNENGVSPLLDLIIVR
nr:hypothetical protein [Tanacetum cinerariifolium]